VSYPYHRIIWTLQEFTDRWPITCFYVACWPLILSIFELTGGRLL
jgi:hypothetical protein